MDFPTNPVYLTPAVLSLYVYFAASTGSPDFSLLPESFSLCLHSFSSVVISGKAEVHYPFFRSYRLYFHAYLVHLPFCLLLPDLSFLLCFADRLCFDLSALSALFLPVPFSADPFVVCLFALALYSLRFAFDLLSFFPL